MSKSLLAYSAADIVRILRQAGAVAEVPVRAHVIGRVSVGIAGHHAQAVIVARVQRDLQTVVVRAVDVSHLENVGQVGELGGEGSIRFFASVVIGSAVVVGWPCRLPGKGPVELLPPGSLLASPIPPAAG